MRKLAAFNQITLDGYFTGPGGDLSWAKADGEDPEFQDFVQGNAKSAGVLVFGRVTYEMMASYWPTPLALKNDPVVAEGMNRAAKIVFSRKLTKASWSNTTLVKGDLVAEVRKLKAAPGDGMAILGSGSIIAQLAPEGLIDEYQILVSPVALGAGRTMFEGVKGPLGFALERTRAFRNGKVLLNYRYERGSS
ncbi:MAG TPA: dihydrofolate reductase family protein [Gemmatimonadales bacterium]|nr:dihydrofolate reductase family protein [Gemmatimonadales bacterium]